MLCIPNEQLWLNFNKIVYEINWNKQFVCSQCNVWFVFFNFFFFFFFEYVSSHSPIAHTSFYSFLSKNATQLLYLLLFSAENNKWFFNNNNNRNRYKNKTECLFQICMCKQEHTVQNLIWKCLLKYQSIITFFLNFKCRCLSFLMWTRFMCYYFYFFLICFHSTFRSIKLHI